MTLLSKNVITGQLKRVRGILRSTLARCTENEHERVAGKRDELEGVLQARHGLSEDAAQDQVTWLERRARRRPETAQSPHPPLNA